jgi:hypothetical protein
VARPGVAVAVAGESAFVLQGLAGGAQAVFALVALAGFVADTPAGVVDTDEACAARGLARRRSLRPCRRRSVSAGCTTRWTYGSPGVAGQVGGLTNIAQISSADVFGCAVNTSGSVYCWGASDYRCGGGNCYTTTALSLPTTASKVAVSYQVACALLTNGAVYCWGTNTYGNVGDGTTTNRSTPVQVRTSSSAFLTGATDITAGQYEVCAVASGDVYCWGGDEWQGYPGGWATHVFGQDPYPTGTAYATKIPNEIDALTPTKISIGYFGCVCAVANSKVYCWGCASTDNSDVHAVQVSGISAATAVDVSASNGFVPPYYHMCAVDGGAVKCWGNDGYPNNMTPQTIIATSATGVAAGYQNGCAMLTDGTVSCWSTGSPLPAVGW